jgi:hypothetical protein
MATEIPTRYVTFNMNRRWKLHVSKRDGFGVAVNMVKRRHVDDNVANTFISCHSHWKEGCLFILSSFLDDAKGVPLWNHSHL